MVENRQVFLAYSVREIISLAIISIFTGWNSQINRVEEVTRIFYETEAAYDIALQTTKDAVKNDPKQAGLVNRYHSGGEKFWFDNQGYGNNLTVLYGFNFENQFLSTGVYGTYNHLNSINAAAGDILTGLTAIGTVVNTGNSTDPHLHQELYTLTSGLQKSFLSDFFNLECETKYPNNQKYFYNANDIWNWFGN